MALLLLLVICLRPLSVGAQDLVIGPPVESIDNPGFLPIYCKVPGLPDSSEHLEWLDRNDNVIESSRKNRIYTARRGGSLHLIFNNWKENDAGTYTCRGDILGRNMNKSVLLYFNDDPDIIISPSEDTSRVEDTGNHILNCEAVGLSSGQTASLEWLDNNMKPIGPSSNNDPKSKRVYTVHHGRRHRLKFDQVKVEDHGRYTCRASLGEESKQKTVRLNVYGVITFPQEDVLTLEKQTGTAIHCQVTEAQGSRNVTVDWLYQNGFTVSGYDTCCPRLNRNFAYQTPLGSTLLFDKLVKDDKRKYYCRVRVDGNTVYKRTELQLHASPQILITPAQSSMRAKKGTSGSMYCKVKGRSGKYLSNAKMEWLDERDNIVGPYNRDYPQTNRVYTVLVQDGTRLQLDQLTSGEQGTYTCRCTVRGNTMISDIQLIVYGSPDTPTNLHAATVESTSITITWDEGYNGDSKQRFIIQYRQVDGQRDGQWTTHPTMPRENNALELTLGGLKPASIYEIRINAVNKYGSSGYTSVNVTTV